jgi:hypothetical protein
MKPLLNIHNLHLSVYIFHFDFWSVTKIWLNLLVDDHQLNLATLQNWGEKKIKKIKKSLKAKPSI